MLTLHVALVALLLPAQVALETSATNLAAWDFRPHPARDFLLPDGWQRVIRPGYPFFVEASLTNEESSDGNRSLVFRMNGGHASYLSPLIEASDEYVYLIEGKIRTRGLVHSRAFLHLEFLDADRKNLVAPIVSDRVGGTTEWTRVVIGPIHANRVETRFLRVGCTVQHGSEKDLAGAVHFDEIRVGRLPRFRLTSSHPWRIFEPKETKRVAVEVTGFENRHGEAEFKLTDETGRAISGARAPLEGPQAGVWSAGWTMPISAPGYYRLEVSVREQARIVLRRRYSVTVSEPVERAGRAFGLTVPVPIDSLAHYEKLVRHSGAGWLKMPLWGSADGHPELARSKRELAFFVERLQRRGADLVGMIDVPPPAIREQLRRDAAGLADIFLLPPEVWRPELDSLTARHGLKVTRWQLGADNDTSLAVSAEGPALLAAARSEMSRLGRDVRLLVPWSSLAVNDPSDDVDAMVLADEAATGASAPGGAAAWRRRLEQPGRAGTPRIEPPDDDRGFSAPAVMTPTDSGSASNAGGSDGSNPDPPLPKSWMSMAPVRFVDYGRESAIADFADRLLTARLAGAGVFVQAKGEGAEPLFEEDGAPTELFTIFRTLAENLGDTQAVGSLSLGDGVENRVFENERRTAIYLRANRLTEVEVPAGDQAAQLDLWGRRSSLPGIDGVKRVRVGPTPVLMVDVDPTLVAIQLRARLGKGAADARSGRQTDSLMIPNPGTETFAGRARIQFPPDWNVDPPEIPISLKAGQSAEFPFTIELPGGVGQGRYVVPVEFDAVAPIRRRFRIPLSFKVGGTDIDTRLIARIDEEGRVRAELTVVNNRPSSASLNARLRAPGRGTMDSMIDGLAPGQTARRTLLLSGGRALIGQRIRVDLEEIAGPGQFAVEAVVLP
jgi:hypothetical protein